MKSFFRHHPSPSRSNISFLSRAHSKWFPSLYTISRYTTPYRYISTAYNNSSPVTTKSISSDITPLSTTTLSSIQRKDTKTTGYKKTFNKLLVANRGEIACRIIKTAKAMGIRTVAVYSDLDVDALHVQLAEESVRLGPGEPADSYLSIDRIVAAAQSTGCDAVHPGYGFLSENAMFVEALNRASIRFVGPSAWAIAAMGDKIQSKKLAEASGVNVIPGYHGEIQSFDQAIQVAHDIGYPVMIKASAGGGGKGMRVAWTDQELKDGYTLAKQESRFAFGDDRLLIEKYIDQPRHIEIQVLGDHHGHVIYLPERECSIQRRNQKVIEESPSVHLDPKTRQAMGEQAVTLAKHVGYSSAGTVEFLVDRQHNFYFLEMNTRLQVEHPITEYVTGLDLVEQMLYSAAGYPLDLQQSDIQISGWAMEARVYAEDPEKYLPSVGRLLTYQEPWTNNGDHSQKHQRRRCDSGFMEGSNIHVEYDPLICKLVTHGENRQEAMNTMVQALDEYVIKGVTHNIPLLRGVVAHPQFRQGDFSTNFLMEQYPNGFRPPVMTSKDMDCLAAIVSGMWLKKEQHRYGKNTLSASSTSSSMWVHLTDEQNNQVTEIKVDMDMMDKDKYQVCLPGLSGIISMQWPLDGLLSRTLLPDGTTLVVQHLDVLDFGFRVQYHGSRYKVAVLNSDQHQLSRYMKRKTKEEESKWIPSPMPGRIISIAVKEGDKVKIGEELAVVEAMKMQNILRTSRTGTIKKIYVIAGNTVKSGQLLIEFQDES
ncbi:carbamoyl-phosphate synthase L chain, ATP binding domain-containing protein [Halteromyces radiatus]|uniref:carbamoyl-phosphate synthase L chain, ATP binding domain-containing protein n=1 Tax=Halteromyces radiatus TaxID=101107 RepID=UPI00221FF6F0|nr:carbamoyl-phosphate synthase L chain, ATP binding domain-containing protein [Halteromyces radiatus]KAI8092859.1 carbamoyl-phosphate synthase L chain, ATP binding domain-containing protein [Halteromyces radiatus]